MVPSFERIERRLKNADAHTLRLAEQGLGDKGRKGFKGDKGIFKKTFVPFVPFIPF